MTHVETKRRINREAHKWEDRKRASGMRGLGTSYSKKDSSKDS